MADDREPDEGPSLEMPSFSLRRKRKAESSAEQPAGGSTATPDPAPDSTPETEPEVSPGAEPQIRPGVEPDTAPAPTPEVPRPEPEPQTEPDIPAVPEPEPEIPLRPAPEVPGRPDPEPEITPPPSEARTALPGAVAAALTGLAVGVLAVLLNWLALTGCDAARGTGTCGGGPGIVLLLAGMVLLAYAGAWLLRRLGVPDAGSTSTLAVGVVAVLVMLFLLDSLDRWSTAVVVVALAVVAYAGAWRLSTAVVEPGDSRRTWSTR